MRNSITHFPQVSLEVVEEILRRNSRAGVSDVGEISSADKAPRKVAPADGRPRAQRKFYGKIYGR